MNTHESLSHLHNEDANYVEQDADALWQRLSAELEISNGLGRKMLHTRRRTRALLGAGSAFVVIGALFLLPVLAIKDNAADSGLAMVSQGKIVVPERSSLAVNPPHILRTDTVRTVVIREVKIINSVKDIATTDTDDHKNLRESGPLPQQLQPAVYISPASGRPKNQPVSINENVIWEVIQTQVDRNYQKQKDNQKDSGYNKKTIDSRPTEINH